MSLRKTAFNGITWNSIGTFGAGIVSLVITMILARILSPSDFGLLELLVIFQVISETFVDSGFSQAVIRDDKATNKDLTSVFYINLILAFAIYALLYFAAPLISGFYEEPVLINLSRVVFLTIIFNAFSVIQNANFNREINFKTPARASLISVLIAGTIAVILAYNGFGFWALVANIVLYSFLKMFFLWTLSNWRPKGWISFQSIRKYFSFGSNLLAQGLLDKTVTNIESLLIGKIYTKSDLGFFSQARRLNSLITQQLTSVIQRVTYPVLAKISNEKQRLKEGYRKITGITMLFMIPLSFGVIVTADNLISVLLGSKWLPSVPYLQLWTVMGLFVSLHSNFTNIFLVLGKSRQLLFLSIIKQACKLLVILMFVRLSIMSLIWGIVIVSVITSVMYVYYGGKYINYSINELGRDLWQILMAAVTSATAIYLFGLYSPFSNVFLIFGFQAMIMILIYYTILKILKNKYLNEFVSIIKTIKNKK